MNPLTYFLNYLVLTSSSILYCEVFIQLSELKIRVSDFHSNETYFEINGLFTSENSDKFDLFVENNLN